MKLKRKVWIVVLILTIGTTLISCDIPTDMDLDFDGYEIFPSGNPTWPDNDDYWQPPTYALKAAATDGNTVVTIGDKVMILDNDSACAWSTVLSLNWAFNDIIWADTVFAAVGYLATVGYSKDGVQWSFLPSQNFASNLMSVAYGNGRLVATGIANGSYTQRARIYVSNAEGAMELVGSLDSITYLTKVIRVDSQFIVCGESSSDSTTVSIKLTSTDGLTWIKTVTPTHPAFIDMIWCDDHYLAAWQNLIFESHDGINWTQAAELSGNITKLYRHDDTYLAVGPSGHISVSHDGVNWQMATFPYPKWLNGSIYAGGQYYVFGVEAMYSSVDALTWTPCTVQ
jgi:hypothetical protein